MNKLAKIISFPKYNVTLPSGKSLFFRPMTVKEESSLLLVLHSENKKSILKTLIEIMESCFEDKVENYSISDFECAFIKLREKSIGEIEEIEFSCPHTKEIVTTKIDIAKEIKIQGKKQNPKLKLDNLLIKLKDPTISDLLKEPEMFSNVENRFKFIANNILEIQKDKEIIRKEDVSEKEMLEFIENLSSKQFKTICNYYENSPNIVFNVDYKTSDGSSHRLKIRGTFYIISFFLAI